MEKINLKNFCDFCKNNVYIMLGCALLLINGLVFVYYKHTVNKIGGEYVYPLDDTYIHLAVAKNAAFYNNWGVGHDEFVSSSSSPLYTFMISVLMRLFGDNALYPLLINILFGNLIIIALYMFIKNKLWFFISIIFCVSPVLLHVQILSGMEHTMHIFMILTAFMLFLKFADSEFNDKKYGIAFLCVSALLCLSRYESMFFLTPIIVILLLNKRYSFALLTFTAGFLPIILFGIWSMSNGGFFFPNSLLMKGDIAIIKNGVISGILHYCNKLYINIIKEPIFIAIITMILIIIIQDFILSKTYDFKAFFNLIKKQFFVFIVLTTIVLHSLFASFGWLFRYEAYLLALLYLTLILVINKNINIAKNFKIALFIIFILYVSNINARFKDAHNTISQAGKNIYDQQIQMSRFLKTYYNESKVMANDIGAITYYTDISLKDLIGLGSNDVVVLRMTVLRGKANDIKLQTILSEYKEYSVIIIYDSWFDIKSDADRERLGLIKIGELWIRDNVVCGGNPVSFYTSDETMVEKFKDNMLKFKELVPKDVNIVVF